MLGDHEEESKSGWNVPLCCLWKERLPHRLQRVWDLVCRLLYAWRIVRRRENKRRNCETYPNEVVPMQSHPRYDNQFLPSRKAPKSSAYEPLV